VNCQQARLLLDSCADGELEAAAILEVELHLQGCSDCARAWGSLQVLRKTLKQDALYFTAPEELRQKIRSALPSPAKTAPPMQAWNWLTTVMSGLAVACLALLLTVTLTRSSAVQPLAQEIVSSHIRSLMANHVMDVVSTDQHTVKPWFNGKLDFSPPVKDLAAQEFPLIGGRLDYVGGRSVAALVFQRHKHVINLFIWPAKEQDSQPAALTPNQGYNMVHWSGAEMACWAVSDLNEKELMEFARDYAATAPLREH
jgi:anti-sigma factor RsiW